MLRTRRALRAPVVLLLVVLALTACADGGAIGDTQLEATSGPPADVDDGEEQAAEAPQPEPADDDATDSDRPTVDATDIDATASEQADGTVGAPATEAAGVQIAGGAGAKPEITLPGGEPPSELVIVDLIEGTGAEVPAGATVTTHYVGVSWLNDGTQFDASWDRGEPISFPLSGVIPGWTEGIPGMRVGGRRMLIIPPDMAYGAQPPAPAIAVDDTLVFVIDLVDVQ